MCELIKNIIFDFITREVIHVSHTTEAFLCNYCCRGTAKFITYSEYVFETLGTQHAGPSGRAV